MMYVQNWACLTLLVDTQDPVGLHAHHVGVINGRKLKVQSILAVRGKIFITHFIRCCIV
jgi:hypothetical protein